MISSAAWVARGKAAQHPTKYNVDDAELERVGRMANMELGDATRQLEAAQQGAGDDGWVDEEDEEGDEQMEEDEAPSAQEKKEEDPNDLSRYRLDEYDEEPSQGGAAMAAFRNVRGLQYYQNNDEDPYITLKDDAAEEEEEREELEVLPTDNLVLTAKTEDELSLLEAYVYSAQDENLYVHHDLMLPSFPLHLEWLDYTPAPAEGAESSARRPTGAPGNYVAVGTMDPEIEIWSMDTIEGLYPDAILGRKDLTESLNAPAGTGKKSTLQPPERRH